MYSGKKIPESKLLRRSSSSSSIPRLVRGGSISREVPTLARSQSSARLSVRESIVKPKRQASLDRKSNLHSTQKVTPLRRTNSYLTPSSCSSLGSRVSPSTGLKKRKTIQQLSTNPNWVANQYAKVQNFILNCPHCDESVVGPKNIRPPSIKGFVYLVSVLFNQIFDSTSFVPITQENYKEEVLRKLKELYYPGNMTISTMKSVNTMHSWPQVIGMLGWLIDKIEITIMGAMNISQMSEEQKPTFLMTEQFFDIIIKSYQNFNQHGATPVQLEIAEEFGVYFQNIMDIDPDEYNVVQAEYEKEKEYKRRVEGDIENFSKENEALKITKNRVTDALVLRQDADAAEGAGLEEELNHYKLLLKKRLDEENVLKPKVAQLEEKIKTQSCSYQDKLALEKTIDSVKKEISIAKEKMEDVKRIRNEYDNEVAEAREMLESEVLSWNRSLMTISIQKPHLKELLLREKGFHNEKFLDEISEVSKAAQKIENEFQMKLSDREPLKILSNEIYTFKTELESLERETNDIIEEETRISVIYAALEADTKQSLSDWDEKKKQKLSEIKKLQEDCRLSNLVAENACLEQRKSEVITELEDFQSKSLEFFGTLYQQIDNNVDRVNQIMQSKQKQIEEACLKLVEEKESFLKFTEKLQK